MAIMGEGNKKEMIIPLEQYKERAIGLWMQAGKTLNVFEPLQRAIAMNLMSNESISNSGVSSGPSGTTSSSPFSWLFNTNNNPTNQDEPTPVVLEIHNYMTLDGKVIARETVKYQTEIQERSRTRKERFTKGGKS